MHHVSELDTQEVMINAAIVRAPACPEGYEKSQDREALGRSKGGTTQIHVLVEALGSPFNSSHAMAAARHPFRPRF